MRQGLGKVGKYTQSREERVEEALLLSVDQGIFGIWLALCFKNDEYDIIHV